MAYRNKPLYQPWNEEEFRADYRVSAMTPIQRWMYRTLLNAAFFCSTRPYLPFNDDELWMMAGCESKEQWMQNKDLVISAFDVQKQNGKKLLSKKRLIEDWERIVEKREIMAQNGRNGGLANANQLATEYVAFASEVREVSKRENKVSEVIPFRATLSKAQTPEARIIEICEASGKTPEDKKFWKADLKKWVKNFGEEAVLSAFTIWTNATLGMVTKKPISYFFKSEDVMPLNGELNVSVVVDKDALQMVLDEIALVSDNVVVFRPVEIPHIAKMIIDYSPKQVIQAFRRFWEPLSDDYEMKFATKNFLEKGPQFLRTMKLQANERTKNEQAMEAQSNEMREQVAKQFADIEEAERLQKEQDLAGASLLEGLIEPEQALNTPELPSGDGYGLVIPKPGGYTQAGGFQGL